MERDINNIPNGNKSDARLKRKNVLRDKGSNYCRATMYRRTQTQTQQDPVSQRSQSTTPLSDITSNVLNMNNQRNATLLANWYSNVDIYTQPDVEQQQALRRRRTISLNSIGVNLMNKFTSVNQNPILENDSNNLNQEPFSSRGWGSSWGSTPYSHQSTNQITQLQTHNTRSPDYDEEENNSEFHGPCVQGSSSDSNSSSDEEEQCEDINATHYEGVLEGYYDIGDPLIECQNCVAFMWYQERTAKIRHTASPKYELCYGHGRVQIPLLKDPPPLLQNLLIGTDSDSKKFQQHIRLYNMMFAFTSLGAKLDSSINKQRGPPTIRIQGQPCHRIGSMLPMPGQTPKFAQLYIYDTDNEIQNRMEGVRNNNKIDPEIVRKFSNILDQNNRHAQSFRMARDRLNQTELPDLKLKLISERSSDGRINNLPTVSEVAALIVGDVDNASKRDIIMETRTGELQRIDELHASYLAYQYLLIFVYGEDGYRIDILHRDKGSTNRKKRNQLTIREWISFRIQTRAGEAQTLLRSRRLFHQFLVDAYSMMESERLSFIRRNKRKLRVDKYQNLNESSNGTQSQGSN